ncbi:MAG: hypothetical protein GWO24_19210 [Akkermansiaceae bacterium]|nr:hypothetical protein [Akkermansiaceae bacterium]
MGLEMTNEPVRYGVTVNCGPNDDDPPEWMVVIGAEAGPERAEVPLTVAEARTFARALMEAASFAECQTIGEENAEALSWTPEPPPEDTDEQQG